MKELMVALKTIETTLFVITAENAYPFSLTYRAKDCQSPTIAEIMKMVEDFSGEDMQGYGGVGLEDERMKEAKTIYAVLSKLEPKPEPVSFEAHYTDHYYDTLSIISNHVCDPSSGELYFKPTEAGVVLTKEQALDLASKINKYFNN